MPLLQKIANHFDLNAGSTEVRATATQKKFLFPQYLAVVLGIVVQPLLDYYLKNNSWPHDFSFLAARAFFGLLIGVIIFPSVYRNSWDNGSPIAVQFCSIFTAGLGWQTVFLTVAKGFGHL